MDSAADLIFTVHQLKGCEALTAWMDLSRRASQAKIAAASTEEKDEIWAVETYAAAVVEYLSAYIAIRERRYYEAWCQLEHAEIALRWISLNPINLEIAVLASKLATTVELWQSAFPYRIFASPGYRYKNWKCSICGLKSTPVSPCGHSVGRVYDGKLCTRLITEVDILEISIVRHPVQKYSVLAPSDSDHNFDAVDYIISVLRGPFYRWTGFWTHKRHPHDHWKDVTHEAPCPCGSQLRYSECCLLEEGVRLKHFALRVEDPMPGISNEVISGRKRQTRK